MTIELTDEKLDEVTLSILGFTELDSAQNLTARLIARAAIAADRAASTGEYPALPECTEFLVCNGSNVAARAWNVDQMRAYAAQAVDADRAARGVPLATDPSDPADIIAGALSVSRGHAIEMMREAVIAAQPDRHPIPSPDSTGLAVVDMHYHWRAIDAATQRGVKLQLINRVAGVATLGALGSDPGHWTHWAPLPTFGDRT